jgi:hypothetical protein
VMCLQAVHETSRVEEITIYGLTFGQAFSHAQGRAREVRVTDQLGIGPEWRLCLLL